MRGFWVDERVEANIWKQGSCLFKIGKYFEKLYLLNSAVIITLTRAAKDEIKGYSYLKNQSLDISVIPTCVDLERFRITAKSNVRTDNNHIFKKKYSFVYAGSITTWSMPDELLNFFRAVKQNMIDANFLVLTREKDTFENILKADHMDNSHVSVTSATYESMPNFLSACKSGVAFYKPGYSRKGCCPTKIGEYLACGLPVIINSGIGDIDQIIEAENVGIIIKEFSDSEYRRVVNLIKNMLGEGESLSRRCRKTAEKYFSLEAGIEKYHQVYQRLF